MVPKVLLHISASKSTNVCVVKIEAFFVVSWSNFNAFVSGVKSLRFKSRAGQIERVLPTAGLPCDISSKELVLPGPNEAEMGPPTRDTLRCKAASIMKDLIR